MKRRERSARCFECGGRVRLLAKPGRKMAYRNAPALPIPRALRLPTCDSCGEVYLDSAASRRLDDALESVYRDRLAEIARDALARLRGTISKQDLEASLGLSQGYLSKLPRKPTSPILVSLLALLAEDPVRGLEVVRKLWGRSPKKKVASQET